MRTISQEAVKVAGQVLGMAGDVSAARRVVVEAAGWLCEVEGVPLVDDAAVVPVVADVFGDVDWQATARGAGWLDADAAGVLLVEVDAAREAAAAADGSAECERLRGELDRADAQARARARECDKLAIEVADAQRARERLQFDLAQTCDKVTALQAEVDGLRAELIAARVGGKVVDILPAAKVDQVVSVPGTLPGRTAAPAPAPVKSAPAPAGDVVERPDKISEAAWASMPPQLRKFAAARAAAAAGQAS